MPINYVIGDATAPVGDGRKILVHICNDSGAWGKGFVMAVSRRWPQTRASYLARRHIMHELTYFPLGEIQLVGVEPDLWVVNLIGQHGLRAENGVPPVRYDAVRTGLATTALCALSLDASIHMPRICCGLGLGRWDKVEPIIEEELLVHGLSVTVYDLPA